MASASTKQSDGHARSVGRPNLSSSLSTVARSMPTWSGGTIILKLAILHLLASDLSTNWYQALSSYDSVTKVLAVILHRIPFQRDALIKEFPNDDSHDAANAWFEKLLALGEKPSCSFVELSVSEVSKNAEETRQRLLYNVYMQQQDRIDLVIPPGSEWKSTTRGHRGRKRGRYHDVCDVEEDWWTWGPTSTSADKISCSRKRRQLFVASNVNKAAAQQEPNCQTSIENWSFTRLPDKDRVRDRAMCVRCRLKSECCTEHFSIIYHQDVFPAIESSCHSAPILPLPYPCFLFCPDTMAWAAKIGRKIDHQRVQSVTVEVVQAFFTLLQRTISEFRVKTSNIWNMNETGIALRVCTN